MFFMSRILENLQNASTRHATDTFTAPVIWLESREMELSYSYVVIDVKYAAILRHCEVATYRIS